MRSLESRSAMFFTATFDCAIIQVELPTSTHSRTAADIVEVLPVPGGPGGVMSFNGHIDRTMQTHHGQARTVPPTRPSPPLHSPDSDSVVPFHLHSVSALSCLRYPCPSGSITVPLTRTPDRVDRTFLAVESVQVHRMRVGVT